MGLVSILLGLALVGVLADFLAENDVLGATERQYALFDHTLRISVPVLVAVSFAVGLIAMLLILAGIRRMRHKSHSQLKSRVTLLENENARLITRENLPNVIPVPETERLAPQQRPTQPPPGAPVEQAPVTVQRAEPVPSTEAPKPAAAQVKQAPGAAPVEQPMPSAKPQPAPKAQPATAAQAVPAVAAAKASHPAAAKAKQAPAADTVVELPEPEPETPVEPPRQEPVGLPPEQAAEKRAALARTAAAKKIGTPEPEHDDRTKPSAGYEDPPPSTPPEAFLDLQREIAAKTDAEQPPTLKPKPARSRTAKAKPTPAPAPAPARADAEEPAPAPKDDVVVVPEAEEEEEESLASTAPSDTSVPTTWEWP